MVTTRYPHNLPSIEEIDGIRVRRLLFPNLLPSPGRRSASVIVKQVASIPMGAIQLARLIRLIRQFRPDVVNAHYFSYPVGFALLAARAAKVPAVLCFHGSDVPGVPYPATYGWAARWGVNLTKEVICCSNNLRDYLLRALTAEQRAKVTVSHYGVDSEPLVTPAGDGALRRGDAKGARKGSPTLALGQMDICPSTLEATQTAETASPSERPPFAVLLARLVEKKGVDTALRAMRKVKDEIPDARLSILGDGPLESNLTQLARDLMLDDSVQFVGSMPHDDAMELTQAASFVVVPSHWEAFGQVCLEAMASGKAVIATYSGGPAEIIVDGKTGLLVPPAGHDALAAAMIKLFTSPSIAREMGRSGRVRAATVFTWENMARRYEAAFARAIGGRFPVASVASEASESTAAVH